MRDKSKLKEEMLEKMEEILNSDEIMKRPDEVNEIIKVVEDFYDIQED